MNIQEFVGDWKATRMVSFGKGLNIYSLLGLNGCLTGHYADSAQPF